MGRIMLQKYNNLKFDIPIELHIDILKALKNENINYNNVTGYYILSELQMTGYNKLASKLIKYIMNKESEMRGYRRI